MHSRFFLPAFFLLAAFTSQLSAQSYRTAAGIRVDQGFNLSLQQYIANGWTAEGIVHTSLGSDDIGLTLLAEKHQKILFRNINLYWGAGGHYYLNNTPSQSESVEAIPNVYGVSALAGAELSLGRFNVSVDWKPELHLGGETPSPFEWNSAAVSVRYVILKREKKTIKDWKVFDKDKKDDKKKDKKDGKKKDKKDDKKDDKKWKIGKA
ncbi:MAG: hypothetical protein IT270_07405 [Saprospiraceae bacterium]|nr:hypothetical protein [Saprospiraceae bacterium]